MKNNDDFGYFGKGIDGYVHYKQSFDSMNSGNNSTGKTNTNKPISETPHASITVNNAVCEVWFYILSTLLGILCFIGTIIALYNTIRWQISWDDDEILTIVAFAAHDIIMFFYILHRIHHRNANKKAVLNGLPETEFPIDRWSIPYIFGCAIAGFIAIIIKMI